MTGCARRLWLLACTLVVLCSQASFAVSADTGNQSLVYKLWKINDSDLLLDNIKSSLINGKTNLLSGLSDNNAVKIKQIVDENFNQIKAHMLQYMAQKGSSTQLKSAFNWLETPMGKKISGQHLFALMMFTDPETPIPVKVPTQSPERSQLQDRFERIIFTDVNTFQTATLALFMTLENQTRQPEQRLTDLQLEQQIKSASVGVSSITNQVLPHVFDRLFSTLSLEETTVVINFLDSAGGRQYDDLLLDAYRDAISVTLPDTLLQISKLFDSTLSILSPYSKEKLTDAKQRELMALLIKQNGKPTIIRAMIEARAGQITITTPDGDTKEVYGRPSHKLVTLDTLMTDLARSGMDIRGFYKVLQKQLHEGQ